MAEEKKEFLAEKIARERKAKNREDSFLDTTTESYEKNSTAEYISPFDNLDEVDEDEEEYDGDEEEEEADESIVENRVKSYLIVVALLYMAFLGFGWYMTSYTGTKPQILTMDMRGQQVYMERADEFIITAQNLHAEVVEVIEQFEGKTFSSKEAVLKLQKISEKAQKTKEEASDIVPPQALEVFHSQVGDLLSVTLGFASGGEAYVQNPNEKNGNAVKNAHEKFLEISGKVLAKHDAFYKQS